MKLLIAIAVIWSIVGLAFYLYMFNRAVKRQPQKFVLYLVCGPIMWITGPLVLIEKNILVPLENWLTKE